MKQVRLEPIARQVEVVTEERLLDALLVEQLPVLMACGGKGLCATCHVVIEDGMADLTPPTRREQGTLRFVVGANDASRLACQARVLGDAVRVRLPEGMYIERAEDLESLLGKRAREQVLHPITAQVLIARGKIITRSRIEELKSLEVDVRALTATPEEEGRHP